MLEKQWALAHSSSSPKLGEGDPSETNVAGWPAGTYILHIQTPLGVSTKRLVVAR